MNVSLSNLNSKTLFTAHPSPSLHIHNSSPIFKTTIYGSSMSLPPCLSHIDSTYWNVSFQFFHYCHIPTISIFVRFFWQLNLRIFFFVDAVKVLKNIIFPKKGRKLTCSGPVRVQVYVGGKGHAEIYWTELMAFQARKEMFPLNFIKKGTYKSPFIFIREDILCRREEASSSGEES